jgi:hypothetical protein
MPTFVEERKKYLARLEALPPEELPLLAAQGAKIASLLLQHGSPLPDPMRSYYLEGRLLGQI